MVALFVQFGVTVWADQKVGRDFMMTHRADLALFNILEHRLTRKLAFVFFRQRFTRAENQIEQQARKIKHHDEGDRERLSKNIARARTRITKRPDDHRNPNGEQIRADAGDKELKDRAKGGQIR